MVNLIKVFEFSYKKLRIINYLLISLIIIVSLLLVRNIIETSYSKKESLVSMSQHEKKDRRENNRKNIMNYAPILEKNPFGPPMKLTPIAISQENEKKVYGPISELILVGTAVGPDNLSYAIFEDNAQSSSTEQEVFALGEKVFNYGTLKKINIMSVEIERDGMIYTVDMPADEVKPPEDTEEVKSINRSKADFAKKIGEKQYLLDRRKVQESLENPEKVLTDARLLPVIREGRQEGFSISEVVSNGLYHSLGLRNGDILLRINGLEISNPEVAVQAMSALRGMNTVTLDIIRRGKNMSMSYQIR